MIHPVYTPTPGGSGRQRAAPQPGHILVHRGKVFISKRTCAVFCRVARLDWMKEEYFSARILHKRIFVSFIGAGTAKNKFANFSQCLNTDSVLSSITLSVRSSLCVLIQASSEAHRLQRQPWDQSSETGAVPHTSAAEGGVHTTSASQAEGECGETPTPVSIFFFLQL